MSIDSCQNGTCADHHQKNNNVGSGTRSGIFQYKPDGYVMRIRKRFFFCDQHDFLVATVVCFQKVTRKIPAVGI